MPLLIHSPKFSIVKAFFNPNPIPKAIKGLKNDVTFRSTARAGAGSKFGAKGCEVGVSELNQNMMLYGQFSAPVKEEMKPTKEEEDKQNYYINMGYAINTLREEFPDIFYKELNLDTYKFQC